VVVVCVVRRRGVGLGAGGGWVGLRVIVHVLPYGLAAMDARKGALEIPSCFDELSMSGRPRAYGKMPWCR